MSRPKFVQIACSVTKNTDTRAEENVYALCDDGYVWFYDFKECKWSKLRSQWKEDDDS